MSDPFDYLGARDDADSLIADFGADVNLRRTSSGGPAFEPTFTTTDYPTQAVKVDFTFTQRQGGDIQATDERWLVAAGPLTALGVTGLALPDAIVTGDGKLHPLLIATPLAPAGVTVMYDCHIRY